MSVPVLICVFTLVVVKRVESKWSKSLVIEQVHFYGIKNAADDVGIDHDPIHNFEDNIDLIDPIMPPDHVEQQIFQVKNIEQKYYHW